MNTNHLHIRGVTETQDPVEANRLIRKGGWQLLGVFQGATMADGMLAAWTCYVLGCGDPSPAIHDIVGVEELSRCDANEALQNGAVLLKVVTHQDGEGEYARFIIGRPRRTA